VAASGLVAGLLALPLPPLGSGPEIAATLAVSAVIAMAGLRWGLALLVATEALLVATFWPYLIAADSDLTLRLIGIGACLATAPGLISIGRAAPHALPLLGLERHPTAARTARRVLVAGSLFVIALPLF
jgi:hypothetical protein